MAGGKSVILKDKADLTPEFRMGKNISAKLLGIYVIFKKQNARSKLSFFAILSFSACIDRNFSLCYNFSINFLAEICISRALFVRFAHSLFAFIFLLFRRRFKHYLILI